MRQVKVGVGVGGGGLPGGLASWELLTQPNAVDKLIVMCLSATMSDDGARCRQWHPPAAGNVRQAIQLDTAHGQPVLLDSCGDLLAAATSGGYVRMYKLSGRELKQNCGPGRAPPHDGPTASQQLQQSQVACCWMC